MSIKNVLLVESEGCDPFVVKDIYNAEKEITRLYGYGAPRLTVPYNNGCELTYYILEEDLSSYHIFQCRWVDAEAL